MNLVYKIDVSRPVETLDGIASRARDGTAILKRWGGYLRAAALRRADTAEGWPPLAQSTKKKYEATRLSSVTTRGGVRKGYGAALQSYLRMRVKKGDATATSDLAELQRLSAGGTVGGSVGPQGAAVERLRRRLQRAEQQRAKGKRAKVGGNRRKSSRWRPLGLVARQIQWEVQGESVKDLSRVPWSDVHNSGGAAGHGASQPPRPFLLITAADRDELRLIVVGQILRGGR